MTWIANSLWEMITASRTASHRPSLEISRDQGPTVSVTTLSKPNGAAVKPAKQSMQDRYDVLVEDMKATHNIRVRKWRKSSSGVAWTIRYIQSGRIVKLIESPYPRGPMSCAIFLHEIGHHAIGLGVYRPRCLEEYHVWVWAIQTMREKGFNVTPAVERRMERSMKYAVAKAMRRGLKDLPEELRQYTSA
jgi:hypothetical protein